VEQFFDSNGVSIRYVERGHGAPVVLVHSYCGSFEGQFGRTGVADGLAQHYRVIGLDLRGHGGSAKPHDAAQYGVEMALDPVQVRALSEKVLAGNDLLALAAIRRSNRAQVVTDAQMAAVRVPVLGIVGSQDPYVARFRELQRLVADMELVIIDGARHDDAVAQPGFLDAALAFLAAHSA
jgi:pimeloyl-ACP methyl ester carboxylesterase